MLTEVKYGKHISGEVIDFTQHECGGCGIPFYVPTKWLNGKIESRSGFSCPNGCKRIFSGKSEAQKLKERLETIQIEKDKREYELQNKLLDALSEKQKLEKKLQRTSNGLCPCCNRSFQNLKNHMKTKHPENLGK